MKKTSLLFLQIIFKSLFFLALSTTTYGQISKKGSPLSIEHSIDKLSVFYDVSSKFDWDRIAIEDEVDQKNGSPLRVGLSVPVGLDINTSGQWKTLPDGRMMWRLGLRSVAAHALGLVFDRFELPEGSELYLYNPHKQKIIGALGSHNNNPSRVLSTQVISGDEIIIEYIENPNALKTSNNEINAETYKTDAILSIGELIYIYADAYSNYNGSKPNPGASDPCQIDINCSPVGDNWQVTKRGVAHILFKSGASWYVCSGSLINNTNNDATPYFLTAEHCGGDASTDDRNLWQFYFNFERPECGSGTAPQDQTIIGCEFIAKGPIDGGSDFLLLHLNNAVPESYKPYFNGWSISSTAPVSAVSIHHPSGDVKKISTSGNVINNSSSVNIGGSVMPAHSTWRVIWSANDNGWGVTEGGSSGSPLFDEKGLIIGTLSGGSSSCDNQTYPDYYGKFSYHWESNGANDNQKLTPWLDPNSLGITELEGFDPFSELNGEVIFEESFEGSTFPPEGWSLETTIESNTWQVTSGYTINGDNPIDINPQEGDKFAYVQWQEGQQQDEWLISPKVDLTSDNELALSFWFNGSYHWSVENDLCDLTVKARIGEGDWIILWTEHDYGNWTNYTWHRVSITDLVQFQGQENVQFAFVYTGDNGANFNLDNIRLIEFTEFGDPSLSPPRNLVVEIDEFNVELSWHPPSQFGDPGWAGYATLSDMDRLVWATPERATLFDVSDFDLSYPVEITAIGHVFFQHDDYQWPNDSFIFKIYSADDNALLYTSDNETAQHYVNQTFLLKTPVVTNNNFYVSIVPTDESGHPSSGAMRLEPNTGNSFHGTSGNWQPYTTEEDAFELVTSVQIAGEGKLTYGGASKKRHSHAPELDMSKVAKIPEHELMKNKETKEAILSGYKVYRDDIAIATLPDPEETSFVDVGLATGSYKYYVTAIYTSPDGESKPSNSVQVLITSIESETLQNTLIYPNPFGSSITIKNAEKINRVVISNLLGQTVKTNYLNGSELYVISTNSLPNGLYLVSLIGIDGNRVVVRMIKN